MKLFGVGQDEQLEELDEELEMPEEEHNDVWQLALDILETDNDVIILSPIAWIDLSEIDVSYNKWVLVIAGNRKRPSFFEQDIILRNSECYWGPFSRNIILPENLNSNTIEATMEHNLLVITIQKLHFEPNSSIKINRTGF
jgi:HSP20 family molecular chaperone IbpA